MKIKRVSLLWQVVSAIAVGLCIAVGSFMGQVKDLPWFAWLMWVLLLICIVLISLAAFFGGDRA